MKKCFIDRWVDCLAGEIYIKSSQKEQQAAVCANISLLCKPDSNILITSSLPDGKWEIVAEDIVQMLKEKQVNIIVGKNPCNYADTIEKSRDITDVVLIEEYNKTSLPELIKLKNWLENKQKSIMGVVTLNTGATLKR